MEADPPSLLSQLQGKLKRLQPTQTKLTRPDGNVSYFQNQGQEKIAHSSESSFGFVVDTKPDLTVGKVLPWLFISSQDVPQDLKLIQEFGITHILSLLPDFQLHPLVRPLVREHLVLEFYDEESFVTSKEFDQIVSAAMHFISNAEMSSNGYKVLIHCNAGLSRAPTMAMLYLMESKGYDFDSAWEAIISVRSHAKPNAGFCKYLRTLKK